MLLKIELLSDLCTYSGDIYNSLVDIDVVYDDYGLPYIPAKRLKGCIREACLELVEFGIVEEESYNRIFGSGGNRASGFTISNAYPENYDVICEELEEYRSACESRDDREALLLIHPQNVLGLYTYTRTQTSMDYETGTAKKNMLRTMRVVKRGEQFQAQLHVGGVLRAEDIQNLKDAAELVTHMGVHRTRGLGLVRITVTEEDMGREAGGRGLTAKDTAEWNDILTAKEIYERNLLEYRVYLESPLICKSAQGNQARSQDFIEGGKILGMIAGGMGERKFKEISENELVVSNAYIECNGKRCHPVSASLQKVKDQTFDGDGRMEVYDMLTAEGVAEQLTPAGFAYMTEDGLVKSVSSEIHYHHSRPDDKSIGRADGGKDSAFYQLESIRKGQAFRGYILADKKQAGQIEEAFLKMKNARMGYGKNAEYGAVRITVERIEELRSEEEPEDIRNDFVIRLDSPVILYNESGMPTADAEVFRSHIARILGAEDLVLEKCFLRYETIGGFNVTWGRRKPVFSALGKGCACWFHSEKGADVSALEYCFVGERVSEGYGEIKVLEVPKERYILRKHEEAVRVGGWRGGAYILPKLRDEKAVKDMKEAARLAAMRQRTYYAQGDNNAVIGRLILVSKEQPGIEEMWEQVDGWESESKKETAKRALEDIGELLKEDWGEISGAVSERAYSIITSAYLQQMKHQFRADTKQEGDGGDERE